MNDNDVIKKFTETFEQYKAKGDFRTTVYKEVLDLINRLQAENERLQEEKAKFDNTILYDLEQVNKIVENSKSEARKEFAERLCEGRVSNDPVVIAVKVELEMMDGKENENA